MLAALSHLSIGAVAVTFGRDNTFGQNVLRDAGVFVDVFQFDHDLCMPIGQQRRIQRPAGNNQWIFGSVMLLFVEAEQ